MPPEMNAAHREPGVGWGGVAIGIGGMVGVGIFSILGLAAGGGVWRDS